jgi:parallel beta-helix repeat protein
MKFFRKNLVIGIIFLFVGASIVQSISSSEIKKTGAITTISNTWIVDDDGDGNFSQIQEAINNESVKNGDIILVYNGTYLGDIQITKQLKIKGMRTEYPPTGSPTPKPIIDGGGFYSVVEINIDEVIFSGFTLLDSIFDGIRISDNIGNIVISDNTLIECGARGIDIYHGSNNNIISGNTIIHSEDHGIRLQSSQNNTISYNTIINHDYSAIYLYSSCRYNNIYNNKIMDFHLGLYMEESHFNNIYWNNITNGNLSLLEDSNKNEISQNTFKNCSIFFRYSFGNQIYHNNFFNLKKRNPDGFFLDSRTNWLTNYWGEPKILPKIIPGIRTISGFWKFRWLPDIDWRPALKPFKIPV